MLNYLTQELHLPCGTKLSNRLCKAAMTEGLADPMNRATARHVALYTRWTQGGAGLMLSGNVQVDRNHLDRPGSIAIDNNGGIDALRAVARAGTRAGNHFWMQMNHAGRQTAANINPAPLAPSAIPFLTGQGYGMPREMTEAQILDVVRRFAHVAAVARDCGFTGVQVHAAHGYLLSQFLNPLANRRRDAWGGSLENRARLLLEVVRGVRKVVGPDYPVAVKLNSADFQKGGFTSEESVQVVRWLADASADLLEVSGGNYESYAMLGRPAEQPKAESTRRREAYFMDYAALVRPVTKMPLMITGGFRTRAAMEEALKAGELDMIGLARPLCVEPEACNGLISGAVTKLPTIETDFVLKRSDVDPSVDDSTFHVMQAGAETFWAYLQVIRFGDGKDADLNLTALRALAELPAYEQATLKAWRRPS